MRRTALSVPSCPGMVSRVDVVVDSNVLIDYLKERDGFALARKLLVFSEMGD